MPDEDDTIVGLDAIAEHVGRSSKTVARYIASGILPARKAGPFPNSPVIANRRDLDRVRAGIPVHAKPAAVVRRIDGMLRPFVRRKQDS